MKEDDMDLAIIGTGNVGAALGGRWAASGRHQVTFGTREPGSEKIRALIDRTGGEARAASAPAAAAGAQVVVLATPWSATEEIIGSLGDLSGKIVVDCTNPLTPDLSGLAVGPETSGGELVARWATGARVVKAFNTTGSGNMSDSGYGSERLAMLLCGDDAEAKTAVAGLAEELGFEAVDAGPLGRSRQLEQLAVLWIALAYQQDLGMDFGFALLRRPT
ncbi:MAG: NADPH-dependent F420 reductase [Thermoanaerobaculia bacterium]